MRLNAESQKNLDIKKHFVYFTQEPQWKYY